MTLKHFLTLGRLSSLPTVWTNGLAGWLLTGMYFDVLPLLALMVSLSLFYLAGMLLSDAFDTEAAAAERLARPIPKRAASRAMVFRLGFGMLGAAVLIGFFLRVEAGFAGVALALAIVAFDYLHKQTPLAPVLMGLVRMLTYAMAALAASGEISQAAIFGAIGLFAHVAGLSYIVRQAAYNRTCQAWPLAVLAVPLPMILIVSGTSAWPWLAAYAAVVALALGLLFRRKPGDVPKAVATLIAAIALYDAALLSGVGFVPAVIALCGFGATLALRRRKSGT